MALPPRDQRHQYLRFAGLQYTKGDIADYQMRLAKIYKKKVPQPPPPAAEPVWTMAQRLAKVEEDVHEIRRALGKQREILDNMACDFSRFSTWTVVRLSQMMSQAGVRDPIPRLCHNLIACSIARRSQVSEKVTVTDLFYLRGMDIGSVNVPYLLARYLRFFASGRKQGAMIFGGQFVARVAEHFRLLTEERLQGLTVIVRDLPVIDMAEYTSYADFQIPYERRSRCRTDNASTSTTQ
nr:hypothetical protein [Tanacetum cinerariifolium]